MSKTLRYKEYLGSIEVSVEDNCLHGRILFISDLVTYEASSPHDLEKEFQDAVNDYVETCKELDREAQKPFSGTFNVRVGEKLHRKSAVKAAAQNIKLNELVKVALNEYVSKAQHDYTIHHHHHNHNHIVERSFTLNSDKEGEELWTKDVPVIQQH